MLDVKKVGAMGYSFDGYNALVLGGARVDSDFYQAQCASPSSIDPSPKEWWIDYICNLDEGWEGLVDAAGPDITSSEDGLWQPITDPRIKAVMPMAPEGAWLFGDRGLAAVDQPTLILGATADVINYYDLEAANIFEHLGAPNKSMVSFINQDHMMIFDDEQIVKMKHFCVAFFGYHLQGKGDYTDYYSERFIAKFDDFAWGVVKE